ncbi:hypothetical protein L1887_58874 [Cichorium endivia]|nr:hypothetical protein L1887_58874 [Cichorium endivia]
MLRQGRRIGVLGGIIVKKLGCQSCKSFQSPKGRQVKKLKLILCPGTPTAHLDRHVLRCAALCCAVLCCRDEKVRRNLRRDVFALACGSRAAPYQEAAVVGRLYERRKDLDEQLHLLLAHATLCDVAGGRGLHGQPGRTSADARYKRVGFVLGLERSVGEAKLDVGRLELGARVRVVAVVRRWSRHLHAGKAEASESVSCVFFQAFAPAPRQHRAT